MDNGTMRSAEIKAVTQHFFQQVLDKRALRKRRGLERQQVPKHLPLGKNIEDGLCIPAVRGHSHTRCLFSFCLLQQPFFLGFYLRQCKRIADDAITPAHEISLELNPILCRFRQTRNISRRPYAITVFGDTA